MRMPQASANPSPPPAQPPLMAAISGLLNSRTGKKTFLLTFTCGIWPPAVAADTVVVTGGR